MRNLIKTVSSKGGYLIALALASLAGGLISAIALAAIPDSSGTIHGCYKNSTGMLKVIDNSTASCGSGETGLNWSQNGSGTLLKDANGQVLGTLLDYSPNAQDSSNHNIMDVYNANIQRVISIEYNNNFGRYDFGEYVAPFFQSSDCTGQSYIADTPFTGIKTSLFWWSDGTSITPAIVNDNASVVSVTDGSALVTSDGVTYFCRLDTGGVTNAYPLSSVTIPFTTPISTPFKF